ncbi:uncharacterized protein LOC110853071 [Folsomia candida]|uniref:uncharacterized protein LOC110853071 n=1 Tax=Folsomia candida TaxID=158441 RepID=UPI000B90266B|nr:uncharacterized protein LOC110853071 [Folsomia candida]
MPRDEEKAPAIPQQQQQQNKAPLSKILLVCMISYVGYLLLGAWCYYVEQRHEEEFHNQKSQDADWAEKGLVLELRVATSLMIFSAIRIFLLFIFILEKVADLETVSIIWLSISTLLMMAAYFTACLNLDVFIHIHPFFITLFFVSIGLDFLGNVLVIVRHNNF